MPSDIFKKVIRGRRFASTIDEHRAAMERIGCDHDNEIADEEASLRWNALIELAERLELPVAKADQLFEWYEDHPDHGGVLFINKLIAEIIPQSKVEFRYTRTELRNINLARYIDSGIARQRWKGVRAACDKKEGSLTHSERTSLGVRQLGPEALRKAYKAGKLLLG